METEQETQEDVPNEAQSLPLEQEIVQDYTPAESTEQKHEEEKSRNSPLNGSQEDRGNFIHGLAVGLGIGCIATFVIVWLTVFFTPQLPSAITYENLLTIFIYPLIYLLAVGLIALTAGIVREYYSLRSKL